MDAFAFIEGNDNPQFFSQVHILDKNKPFYNVDLLHLKGMMRLKTKNPEDYQIMNIQEYNQNINRMKINDHVLVYPHDYILNISYNGDTTPKKFKVIDKNPMYIKLEETISSQKKNNNLDAILYYNLEKMHQNRFMIYPIHIKDPVTKDSSFKDNTFFLFDQNVDIKQQIEFCKINQTEYLFQHFKLLKK